LKELSSPLMPRVGATKAKFGELELAPSPDGTVKSPKRTITSLNMYYVPIV
jgi:hypothetical protein